MPIYEYECADCGKSYDVLQRMSDPPLHSCVKCGGDHVTKRLSVPTIIVRRSAPTVAEGTGGITIDAVPDDFRHPRLGVATSRLPGR